MARNFQANTKVVNRSSLDCFFCWRWGLGLGVGAGKVAAFWGGGKVAALGPSGNDFLTGRKTKKDTRSLKAQISQQECEWRVDVVQFSSFQFIF